MKKTIISIFSLAAIIGCSEKLEQNITPADNTEPVVREITIGADANIEESDDPQARATWDANLKSYWEEGDQIKLLHAWQGYQITNRTIDASTLDIAAGAGDPTATFRGNVTDAKSSAYFYGVYPAASATEFNVYRKGSNASDNSVTTTVKVKMDAEQSGKYKPYMFAVTDNTMNFANLDGLKFNTLNAAVSVRALASDRTTPKQLAYIQITSDSQIVGTFEGSSSAKNKIASLNFVGSGKTITASNLTSIEKTGDYWEYTFAIAPGTHTLTFTMVAVDGTNTIRTAPAYNYQANHRKGWPLAWDAASVTFGAGNTWYMDYANNKSTTLQESSIYVNDITIKGVAADQISECGILCDNQKYPYSGGAALDFDMTLTGIASGVHTIRAYATVNGNDIYSTKSAEVTVTSIPTIASHTIMSSYSSNGNVSKTNGLNGSILRATATLSDAYIQSNLVSSRKVYYGDGGASADINLGGGNNDFNVAWGTYNNCYAKIVLANGYSLETPKYQTIVTGIPYSIKFDTATPSGWTTNNTAKWEGHTRFNTKNAYAISPEFKLPDSVAITATAKAYAYGGSLPSKYKPNVYISASSSGVSGGNAATLSGVSAYPSTAKFTDVAKSFSMGTSSVNKICIYTSGDKGSGLTVGTNGVVIKSIDIMYQ